MQLRNLYEDNKVLQLF